MYPTPFALHQPTNVHECVELLAAAPNALIVGGGQHALSSMNRGELRRTAVIALERVAAMASIELATTSVRLGAMVRLRTIEQSPHVRALCPLLSTACRARDPRSLARATLGGCLMLADPTAPALVALIALGARMRAENAEGGRWIPAGKLVEGPGRSGLELGELLVGIEVPISGSVGGWAIRDVPEPSGTGTLAVVAVRVDLHADGTIARANVAIATCGILATRMPNVEALLTGSPAHPDTLTAAGALAANTIPPAAWGAVGDGYRRRTVAGLTRRAIGDAIVRASPRGGE